MTDKRPGYRRREAIRRRLKAMGEPCAICGKPIDYDLDWWVDPKDGKRKRHPLSFEYDHREPFAETCDNSWENAQPAHRICNQRKGKKMPVRAAESHSDGRSGQLPTSRAW